VDFVHLRINLTILGRILWLAILFLQVYPRFDVGPLAPRLNSSLTELKNFRGCKILGGSCGGVTHFALTSDDDGGVMTVAWGQNASYGKQKKPHGCSTLNENFQGELGLGPEEPKSATKPTRNQPLAGINVMR
jgi:hypothetical protein